MNTNPRSTKTKPSTHDPGFPGDTHSVGMGPNVRAIEEVVSLEDYLLERGVRLKNGRCACVVHGGKNPTSMKLLGEIGHCHSCGWSGGVVKLHSTLESIPFWEAIVDLSIRHNIVLPGRPDGWHRKNERQQPIRDGIEEMKVRRLQRFIYKMVEPYIKDAEDAENTWRESRPLAIMWLARMQGETHE